MKKFGIFLSFLVLFIIPTFVSASTNVYERDEDNLQVWDTIKVDESNIDDILLTPKVDEKEKIYDFADLFSDSEEGYLFESVSNYIEDYNMDMVIVTISSNNKRNAKAYAEDFYDYNYFGIGSKYDGIIFLIDMDTREMWISTTGEAMLVYDDARIDNILDKSYVYISDEYYYKAAKSFVTVSAQYASQGLSSSADDYYVDENGDLIREKNVNWGITVVGSIIIASVAVYIFISKHKGIKLATMANDYLDKSSTVVGNKVDSFLTTHTSRTYIGSNSSSSGGGRGISSSRGSSGRSHGGGGRRF